MTHKMTQAEFDTLRPLLRMTPERVESARLTLVEGLTLEAAGLRRPGPKPYTRQAVADAVRIVIRAKQTYEQTKQAADAAGTVLPAGWERVTLIAPSPLVAEFRQRVELARDSTSSVPAKRHATRASKAAEESKPKPKTKPELSGSPSK